MEHNFLEDQIIILTKQTLDIFLKQDNPSELISLYTFYYYTAKWQKTNQPKCTTDFVAKGLRWGKDKVIKVKKQLIDFGLIEDFRAIDKDTKRVVGYYIKMNYIFKKASLPENHPVENEDKKEEKASLPEIEGVEITETNALSPDNINALSPGKKERKKEETKNKEKTFNQIIDEYTDNEELREELKEHLKTRKLKKSAPTNHALELSLKKLNQLASTDKEKIEIVQYSIMAGYPAFYALKKDKPTAQKQAEEDYSDIPEQFRPK